MLAWIRSPRGSTATATVVAVILVLAWLAPWTKPLPVHLPFPLGAPEPEVATAPSGIGSPVAQASAPSAPMPAAKTVAALSPPGNNAITADPKTSENSYQGDVGAVPSFDIVRVEPSGDAVIAGRGEAGSTVILLDGDKPLAQASVDANGQFALLPPRLDDGNHYLSLRTQKDGKAGVKSVQGVAVAVAKGGASKPLVALLSPDAPTRVLSDGSNIEPAATKAGGDPAASTALPVTIQSVEAGRGGQFMASGVAHPGNQCRVYLNGAYLADVTAGKDGRWAVAIEKGMKPGRYTVRADELAPGGSAVTHRAEVPFDYPGTSAQTFGASGRQQFMSRANGAIATGSIALSKLQSVPSGSAVRSADASIDDASSTASPNAATAVIPNLGTATVSRGDSLWRISKKMLGHGIQYTEIYASNVQQIRNPALIYPGQVFVVPSAIAR